MAEKLFDNDEFYLERFQCDCLSPEHCIDIYLELTDEGKRVVMCGMDVTMKGKAPLRFRIKEAFKYIIGIELTQLDYVWRVEDIPRVISIFKRALRSDNG